MSGVHLRLSGDLTKRIDEIVKAEGYRSRQEFIEMAIIAFFKAQNKSVLRDTRNEKYRG